MADTLVHRGPDDEGVWVDQAAGLALAHRRLSIIDLSPAGHQPMISSNSRYVIVFNGEIYNHLELREAIEAGHPMPVWRGHSDTETLLGAVSAWGVGEALVKAVGMFAFALWDRETRVLTLARDRIGEKPLYYGLVGGSLVFGSELKAVRAFPGFDRAIDRRALALYMRHTNVPSPWSIYRDIWKLPPGCYLQVNEQEFIRERFSSGWRGDVKAYWSARAAVESGMEAPFSGDENEALTEVECLLRKIVAGQMLADVPLGAFLSGGLDSSAVVALMQTQSRHQVRTFTIGFHEGEFDEATHAKQVARHLGTEHTELYVTPQEAMDVIPKLSGIYDEPFADSSQLPACLLARMARRSVTVALSGDGGDEVFGGYNRYFWASALWRKLGHVPRPVRQLAAGVLNTIPATAWHSLFSAGRPLVPSRLRHGQSVDKLRKLAGVLDARGPQDMYLKLVSQWKEPLVVVHSDEEPSTTVTHPAAWLEGTGFEQRMMYLDTVTYLPDDILFKMDRAAMSVCLEARMPYLDHRLVELAWRLPLSMKIRNGRGKWILRQILNKYVPENLVDRPKMGFGVPLDSWLRGPLREWAEALLDPVRMQQEGYLNDKIIQKTWNDHLSGRNNWGQHIWTVLMFQSWLDYDHA